MPRAQESPEGKILRYFQQAPLDAANLVLGLVKDVLYHRRMLYDAKMPSPRVPMGTGPKKSHHKAKAHAAATMPAGEAATPLAKPKKSHHKKGNAGTGKRHQGNEAEVESFSLPDRG